MTSIELTTLSIGEDTYEFVDKQARADITSLSSSGNIDIDNDSIYDDPNIRPHMVIDGDRNIIVHPRMRILAVQYDHNVESVTFDCPRYWDDTDLSTLDIYVNYETPDGKPGTHKCTNVAVDANNESMIHFVWTILSPVTYLTGKIQFSVCAQMTNDEYLTEQRWHTLTCYDCEIAAGLRCMNEDLDNAVVVPDNYNVEAELEALRAEIANIRGMFMIYDSDNNGVVDNSEAVNGVILGADDDGIYILSEEE